ncbi:integral membrane protein [Grosmannia clavigera kw1407]|uniref:Integral membrane protein n=1 Tax=Grosmannia clavigera (strain kw1407 / UAMH 11150) TaxID=655863 RepID=F0X7Q7_GROCL|nr:uncharacterized protein CMQ_6600 [Grosmannia clavigera kw1407]EFX06279.1 integral membrane protein [Grosmannia clavigera kw1407]
MSSLATTTTAAAPFYPLSDVNHSGLVVLAAVIFLIYAVLGVGAKLIIRFNITSIKSHDVILLVGALLYFVQTVCIIVACNRGIGLHQDTVSAHDYNQVGKLIYCSRILAIIIEACTKISLCLLVRQINHTGLLKTANHILGAFIAVWAVSGSIATIFQCHLPRPWLALSKEQCPSRGPIYMYNGIINILTDIALCILPIGMMWGVHTTPKRKIVVVALFGTRIIVPAVTIPSLSTAAYLYDNYADSTWHIVPSLIWLQISLGLSILTACIPSLKGIADSLLGATAVSAVQAPYNLRTNNKTTGIELTSLREPGSTKHSSTWAAARDVSSTQRGRSGPASGAESVRGLTDGVVHVYDEIDVQFEDNKRTSASHDGSIESAVSEYHQHV